VFPGTGVVLYRPSSNAGLATGPIAVGVADPKTGDVLFEDTGQGLVPNLPAAVPASNTTGTLSVGGTATGINVAPQSAPGSVTVTPTGTPGATTVTYGVSSFDATGETTATTGSTATSNATISSANPNAVTWTPAATSPLGYYVYRTAGGPNQGRIGTVLAGQPLVFVDKGQAGSPAAPTSNTTGQLQVGGNAVVTGQVGTSSTSALGVPRWIKVSVSYTVFSDPSTSKSVTIYTLPAGGVILAAKIKHSVSFTGGGIGTYTISVSGTLGYMGPFNVSQATGTTVGRFQFAGTPTDIEDQTASTAITATATSVGDNLDQATQGSADIWLLVSVAT
jgi:hypothetical protein